MITKKHDNWVYHHRDSRQTGDERKAELVLNAGLLITGDESQVEVPGKTWNSAPIGRTWTPWKVEKHTTQQALAQIKTVFLDLETLVKEIFDLKSFI